MKKIVTVRPGLCTCCAGHKKMVQVDKDLIFADDLNGFLSVAVRFTGLLQKVLIVLIKGYQKYVSPLKSTKCPYYPSCSKYGLEAVQKYGALKGGLLAMWRIVRCNPFSKGGYDPVP